MYKPEKENKATNEEINNTLFEEGGILFNDVLDDRIYQKTFAKHFYLTEQQYEKIQKRLLNESRGSKNLHQVRNFIRQNTPNLNPDEVISNIRHDIPNIRLPRLNGDDLYQFALGVVRMYLNGEIDDVQKIADINTALKYVATNAHIKEYDKNLNNLSFNEFVNRFKGVAKDDIDQEKNRLSQQEFNGGDYNIVPIDSHEEAEEYSGYTTWCVTEDYGAYNNYIHGGSGRFYFCLKNGFEDIEPIRGEGCPLDEYGLSMIAVSINSDGSPNTITCRWNHSNGGNDNILTPEELSNIIGHNFYDVFKPYTEEELKVKEQKRIEYFKECFTGVKTIVDENGDSTFYTIVDDEDMYGNISGEGISVVTDFEDYEDRGYRANPTNSKLIGDEIFEVIDDVCCCNCVCVYKNRKFNYLNLKHEQLITDKWFTFGKNKQYSPYQQMVKMHYTGIRIQEINGNFNVILPDGNRIFDNGYSYVDRLSGSLWVVGNEGSLNVYDVYNKRFLFSEPFSEYSPISSDLLAIKRDDKIFEIYKNINGILHRLTTLPIVSLWGFVSFSNLSLYRIQSTDGKIYWLDLNRIGDTYVQKGNGERVRSSDNLEYVGDTAKQETTLRENKTEKEKHFYFTENQMEYIKSRLCESSYGIDPNKTIMIKSYLDNNFVRAGVSTINKNGFPEKKPAIGMKNKDGEVVRNLTPQQAFYLLQDKYKHLYTDKDKRDKFLKQILIDWYNNKISKEGLLSINQY